MVGSALNIYTMIRFLGCDNNLWVFDRLARGASPCTGTLIVAFRVSLVDFFYEEEKPCEGSKIENAQ